MRSGIDLCQAVMNRYLHVPRARGRSSSAISTVGYFADEHDMPQKSRHWNLRSVICVDLLSASFVAMTDPSRSAIIKAKPIAHVLDAFRDSAQSLSRSFTTSSPTTVLDRIRNEGQGVGPAIILF